MSRSESLAAFSAAPLEHEAAIFAGHARAKTMGLRTTSVVRLKSALRHSDESPIKTKTLRLIFVSSYVKKTEASLRSRLPAYESNSDAIFSTRAEPQSNETGTIPNVREPYQRLYC